MHARRLLPVASALVVTLAAAAALAVPAPLHAQGPAAVRAAGDPRGLYYTLRGGATQLAFEGAESYTGAAGGGQVGYNINRLFGLFVGFDYAHPGIKALDFSDASFTADNNFLLTHVELGGRVNLPLWRVLPYIDAAYARRALSYSFVAQSTDGNVYDGRFKYSGNNMLVGAGVQLFLRPTIALDLGGRLSVGELDHAQMNVRGIEYTGRIIGEQGVRFTRLSAGATWYFPSYRFE